MDLEQRLLAAIDLRLESESVGAPASADTASSTGEVAAALEQLRSDRAEALQHYSRSNRLTGADDPVRCAVDNEPVPCSTVEDLATTYLR